MKNARLLPYAALGAGILPLSLFGYVCPLGERTGGRDGLLSPFLIYVANQSHHAGEEVSIS